jgi:hypothetical protein
MDLLFITTNNLNNISTNVVSTYNIGGNFLNQFNGGNLTNPTSIFLYQEMCFVANADFTVPANSKINIYN